MAPTHAPDDFFIPDLCKIQNVFILVLLTEFVAFLFTLVRPFEYYFDWHYLGLVSLFGLWIVLSCAAILCLQRRFLSQRSLAQSVLIAFISILGVVALFSGVALLLFPMEQENNQILWFFLRNMVIAAIIGGTVLRYFYLQYQDRSQKQSLLKAKLEALQSRIRPHFLFNSLNSIAGLIMVNPDKAEEAILDLSELFRASLRTDQLLIPIKDELSLCRKYLNIEQIRLGDRLKLDWQIRTQSTSLKIPPLSLQPLAENAVYHGIEPLSKGGEIKIKVYEKSEFVYVHITNPIEPDNVESKRTSQKQGNQMAYTNIQDRIFNLFGERAVLKSSRQDNTYTVTLRIPKTEANETVDQP